MRIAIVNDLLIAIEALRRIVLVTNRHEIAWVARDGAEAVQRVCEDTPDLILMDLLMPVMDGVEATERIMSLRPCAILIVTATVEANSRAIYEALRAGAVDTVRTPSVKDGILTGGRELLIKIDGIGQRVLPAVAEDAVVPPSRHPDMRAPGRLVAIGASAGGPAALATILREIPADLAAAIVVVQHIEAQFAPALAAWLNGQSRVPVRIAKEADMLEENCALIAASNDHLILRSPQVLGYATEPREAFYRPSVDVFFHSIRRHWRGHTVAVLLTGMGKDGALGLRALREDGAVTIAQDRASSAVFGMPKAAAELNAATEMVPLDSIAQHIVRAFSRIRTSI